MCSEILSSVNDIFEICRLCLAQEDVMLPIFDINHPLALRIMECTSVKMEDGDGLPNLICQQCWDRVDRWFEFRDACEKADFALRQHIRKVKISDKYEEDINVKVESRPLSNSNRKTQKTGKPRGRRKKVENSIEMKEEISESLESRDEDYSFHGSDEDEDYGDGKTNTLSTESKENDCEELIEHVENVKKESDSNEIYIKNVVQKVKIEENSDNILRKELRKGSSRKQIAVEKKVKQYQCSYCPEIFKRSRECKKHQASHSHQLEFPCEICTKVFKSEQKRKVHMRYHLLERKFLCNICGKSFKEKQILERHMMSHSGGYKAPSTLCNICGKSFMKLKRHMPTHTGEKAFVCSFCGKRFRTRDTLVSHAKSHVEGKPFQCKECPKAFKTVKDLRKHQRRHSGEKPYVCRHCGRGFSEKWNRTQHERLHTGEKPYVCDLCNKAFTHNVVMRNHRKQHFESKELHHIQVPVPILPQQQMSAPALPLQKEYVPC